MKTTADFLDQLRALHGLQSDYALAKFTGWERQQVSRYRTMKHSFDDETAMKVAAWLGIEPAYVMANMAAQRAKGTEVKRIWEMAARALAGMGAIAAGLCALHMTGTLQGIDAASLLPFFFFPITNHYTQLAITAGPALTLLAIAATLTLTHALKRRTAQARF